MNNMTVKDYQELVDLLDGRIDELTKPIPSRQILRFAEAIQSADRGDHESAGTYSEEDYSNLLNAQIIVNELLPPILEVIRARSIDPEEGWRFESVTAGDGDHGKCAICRRPYQHIEHTVKVHCLDMHANAFHGVCRRCIREYAPLEFVEQDGVGEWLKQNRYVCESVEKDQKREGQRVDLIDAIREHAESTHYFSDIVRKAPDWSKGAFGEWR
ncbi:hypothetical protein [Planctomicrobium sp. SH664]|uniref:hypothetical protein n=1 Tax=Planctomicrobium sp. SH664 TaxID=3448125 RepID=UPI003F5BCA77